MKKCITLTILCFLLVGAVLADQGMFPMNELKNLDAAKLKAMGLEIPFSDIENRLSKAVVRLGGGSGSFVSTDGLIITNHHVAYGAIQYNSSAEHNYIENGFTARSRGEELPAPGYTASVLMGISDVTDQVTANLKAGMSDRERYLAIEDAIKKIEKDVESKDPDIRAAVGAMYQGKQFMLFRYLRIRDIRLVQAPPASIGEFGGDIDNFEWPRQTGDYSFFRAYVGKDGKPADYSPDNVPYHPEVFLKISLKPLSENDFAMILGYPGSTDRYMTSQQIDLLLNTTLPLKIGLFQHLIGILEDIGTQSPEKKVRVASLIKGLNNAMKKYQGDQEGLTRDHVVARFRQRDLKMQEWLDNTPELSPHRTVIDDINAVNDREATVLKRNTILGYMTRLVSTLSAGRTIARWAEEKGKPDLKRDPAYMDRNIPMLKRRLETMQRNLLPEQDERIMAYMVEQLLQLPTEEQSPTINAWFGGKSNTEIFAAIKGMIESTGLAETDSRLRYFGMSTEELQKIDDPLLKLARQLAEESKKMEKLGEEFAGAHQRLEPQFVELLHRFTHNELYPDANSTLRLTYGKITGYHKDGVIFTPFTTLKGAIEKELGHEPFANPPRLINIYKSGDFDGYAAANLDGQVPLDFLTDCDTTGGNSGSPTLNGKGELIGLLFDGNFESISSDYFFNPALTRSISVDTRYVLFILDKFANARELIDELTLVK